MTSSQNKPEQLNTPLTPQDQAAMLEELQRAAMGIPMVGMGVGLILGPVFVPELRAIWGLSVLGSELANFAYLYLCLGRPEKEKKI